MQMEMASRKWGHLIFAREQKARNRFGPALNPKCWRTGCGSDGESIAVFAMKHIQPISSPTPEHCATP